MVHGDENCALCGRAIQGRPVVRVLDGEEKHFDSEGCARVYQAALDNGMLDQVLTEAKPDRPRLAGLMPGPSRSAHFTIDGLSCPGCATAAERVLRNQPGVRSAEVSFAAQQGRLDYDPGQADLRKVLQRLDDLGYRATPMSDHALHMAERSEERTLLQLITAAAFGMQVMLLYIVQLYPLYAAGQLDSSDIRRLQYLAWALATPALFYGGSSFIRGGWQVLRRGHTAGMDTLVALGTLSAYSYSVYVTLVGGREAYFDSVAMITIFVMLGRYLETLGGAQARKDIHRLLSLQPVKAWRPAGGSWHQEDAALLEVGDSVLVKAGERVPADIAILEGQAALDESLVTGESSPVIRGPGDTILAGTVVTDEALVGRVMRPVRESRLAVITALVQRTLAAKPPIQRLADRASAYFAFGIVGVALVTFVGWLLTGHPLSRSLLAAVSVLVVACPCALGLATPLALAVALGRATRGGVLVRNPEALETATEVNRMVFDKTGTLTRGQLSVVETLAATPGGRDGSDLLCLAAAAEQFSEHPVARAIVNACSTTVPPAEDFRSLRGLGVSARLAGTDGGTRVLVGSSRFLDVDPTSDLRQWADRRGSQGQTVVWVGTDTGLEGLIALRDEPNPSAAPALKRLRDGGVHPVVLSGDSPATTQAIAEELGLADFEGNCPPSQKAVRVKAWQDAGEKVAMVGDGVNDAPALAQANLAITASGGTDVAGETSDLILSRPDLTTIPWFLDLSRRTRNIIQQNLGWAFAYNLVSVPLAAFGFISPVIAALAMATSSLLVVGNSLRLRGSDTGASLVV